MMTPENKRNREEPEGGDSSNMEGENAKKKAKTESNEDKDPKSRTIIVSQLTSKVREQQLRDFFGQIDDVRDVAMPRNENGKHKGVAYVEFRSSNNIPSCVLLNNTVPNFQKFPILVEALGLQVPALPPLKVPPPPPRSEATQKLTNEGG